MPVAAKAWDMIRLIRHGGPAICNIAITNSCNATCGFCNFARGKVSPAALRFIDATRFHQALEILHRRDVRYVSFFGGEPLLHPKLPEMIAMAVARGMGTALITNAWLLPARLDQLAAAGLRTVYVSVDSPHISQHEANRGLAGVAERIRSATKKMSRLGMTALAQVTMSKLISDYGALVPLLRDLGFEAVAFSYPQSSPLGSSSLAWSDSSKLVSFTATELIQAFESVDELRRVFVVNNPRESVADMKRHLLQQKEQFVCYGGYKSFYLDWNFDVWRCDNWREPLCSVWDFLQTPLVRDGCTACVADCYRDSSVMLHFAVAIGDALDEAAAGRVLSAVRMLWDRRNLSSAAAVVRNLPVLTQLAHLG